MANRRMFAKTIISSARFIKMPPSTQMLYFHLGMNADDDGVVEAFTIMRMIGSNEDDLKVLSAKQFIIVLNEDLVSFLTNWNDHNLIRADRKIDSKYKDLLIRVVKGVQLLEAKSRTEETRKIRDKEIKESDLPYSFNYKIKQAFWGELCPVCNEKMEGELHKPSLQHNIPISKGGKHEIDNISIICRSCNSSKQDKPTGKLNNDIVVKRWNNILIGQSNVSPMSAEYRLGKDRKGKDNINNIDNNILAKPMALRKDQYIFDLIELFKPINPSYNRFFKDKTQRASLERLVKQHGEDKIKWTINVLQKTNEMNFAPVITTPYILEKKLADLIIFLKKQNGKFNKNKIQEL